MVLVNLGIAGIAGAVAMAISMALLSKMGEQKADMLRAVGSLITKQIGNALPVGLIIHKFRAVCLRSFMQVQVLCYPSTLLPGHQPAGAWLVFFTALWSVLSWWPLSPKLIP